MFFKMKTVNRIIFYNLNILYLSFIKKYFLINLTKFLNKYLNILKVSFDLNLILIDFPFFKSEFLCRFVIFKLKKKYSFGKIVNSLFNIWLLSSLKYKITGLYLKGSGRFTRAQRASTFSVSKGILSFSSISKLVDYFNMVIPLKYGVCSIKIWLSFI